MIRFRHFLKVTTSRLAVRARFSELSRDRWLARAAAPAAGIALLVAMLAMSRDFGATWDERALQKLGELIWDLYNGRMSRPEFLGTFELTFGYTRIYGLLVEFLSAAAQHIVPADLWVVRHYVNAVFGWTGVVFAFLMASRLFGRRAGWLAAALLVCMPRYVGDSMNNPKDLPFAVLMLAASVLHPVGEDRVSVFLVGACAQARDGDCAGDQRALDGTRAARIYRAGARHCDRGVARFRVAAAGRSRWSLRGDRAHRARRRHARSGHGRRSSRWSRPFEAFFLASGFSWGNPSLFMGEACRRPRRAVVLPADLAGADRAARRPRRHGGRSRPRRLADTDSRARLAALWAFVARARGRGDRAACVAVRRHPAHVLHRPADGGACGGRVGLLLQAVRGRRSRLAAAAFGVDDRRADCVSDPQPSESERVLHAAIGGPRGAFGRYDMDYWGNCVLEAIAWSAAQPSAPACRWAWRPMRGRSSPWMPDGSAPC